MKRILFLMVAVLVNCFVGGTLSAAVGISPMIGATGLNVIAAVSPMFGIEGLRAGLYSELWTGETIKAFRNSVASLGWLTKISSFDSKVAENNTIHFVDLGGDPTVLVNNSTYPIGVENLDDADKAIGLDKYQTVASRVTDDEVQGLSYDKKSTVIERHREVVDNDKYARALHALAPSQNTDKTPVLTTTGANVGNRKRLVVADLIALKEKYDTQKIPTQGRILVLCPEHVNDLLLEDKTFAQRYNSTTSGAISNQYGFEIYEYVDAPVFNVSTLVKKVFGSAAAATDRNASVAYYAPRMMKATGKTKVYLDEPNTQTQEWLYNVRHYFICLPLKNEAIGAIVSGAATTEPTFKSGADSVELNATATAVNRSYATSNGAGVTAESDSDWLTVEVQNGNKVVFTPTAYAYVESGSARVATVTLTIANSNTTKDVTVTQAMATA